MLRRIFADQYAGFAPPASLVCNTSQFRPCQKSPSTKTATLARGKTMSGVPGSVRTFLRNRSPSRQSVLRKSTSGFVSVLVLARFARDVASETARRPTNDGGGVGKVKTVRLDCED